MNWHSGNIAEAVAKSKAKDAIFVVYIEGRNEMSKKLEKFLDDGRVRAKLETSDFVAIKVKAHSSAYGQFISLYKVVPIPSLFFIGKTGTPLNIATGITTSVEELVHKIDTVLVLAGKRQFPVEIADRKIAGADDDKNTSKEEEKAATSATSGTESNVRMVADAQKVLQQKRHERLAREQKSEKENELRRRREGKEAQSQQALSKKQEIKNMQERIRRERQEEQEARERIRAQIAADRAEMTRHLIISADTNSLSTEGGSTEAATTTSASSVDETRLQIRLPGGIHRTKSFPADELLSTVRTFVRKELLAGSNIQDFTLATSYPRREFQTEDESKTLTELNLVPNALVLVLTKEQVSRVVRTGDSIMTMLATVFWALLTPAAKAFDYINKMGIQRLTQRLANIGWLRPIPQQQTAGDDVVLVPGNTASARRNMDMFVLRPAQNPGNQQPQSSLSSSSSPTSVPTADALTPDQKENAATPPTGNTTKQLQAATSEAASVSAAAQPQSQSHQFQQRPGGYQPPRYGDANIRRLQDTKKDDKDNKATYNGNSTQQQ